MVNESLLLTSAYFHFLDNIKDISLASHISLDEPSVTPHWLLSNLIVETFKHHLSCTCKVKKHGTILLRNGGDVLLSLSIALHKAKSTHTHYPASQPLQQSASLKSPENAVLKINAALREQIKKLIQKDKIAPFPYDQLNI